MGHRVFLTTVFFKQAMLIDMLVLIKKCLGLDSRRCQKVQAKAQAKVATNNLTFDTMFRLFFKLIETYNVYAQAIGIFIGLINLVFFKYKHLRAKFVRTVLLPVIIKAVAVICSLMDPLDLFNGYHVLDLHKCKDNSKLNA